MKIITPIAAAVLALGASGAQAADALLSSPDGRITLRIADDASRFSIGRHGETVIADSPLGLELDGQPPLGALTLESRQDTREDRVIPLVATKAATARDHYLGATLAFREAGSGRRLFIDARAYDDGVAFRYRLEGKDPVRVRAERTAFVPAGDPACLVTPVEGAHERPFERLRISQLKPDAGYDVPVVCATPSGRTHYAITQAHLEGYTGASLWRDGAALQVRLSAVPGRSGPALVSASGLTTAWRAVMMADRAGQLIESPLVGNLNPPPRGDFRACIAPGPSQSSRSRQGAAIRTTSSSTSPIRIRSPGLVGIGPWSRVTLRRVSPGSTGRPRTSSAAARSSRRTSCCARSDGSRTWSRSTSRPRVSQSVRGVTSRSTSTAAPRCRTSTRQVT